jgi:hypothetical protein
MILTVDIFKIKNRFICHYLIDVNDAEDEYSWDIWLDYAGSSSAFSRSCMIASIDVTNL